MSAEENMSNYISKDVFYLNMQRLEDKLNNISIEVKALNVKLNDFINTFMLANNALNIRISDIKNNVIKS